MYLESSARKSLAQMLKTSPKNTFMKSIKFQQRSQSRTQRKRLTDGLMCCKDPLNGTIQDGYRHKLKTNQQKQQNKASEDRCVDTVKGKTVSDASPPAAFLQPGAFSDLWCFGFRSGCECETNRSRHIYSTNIKP